MPLLYYAGQQGASTVSVIYEIALFPVFLGFIFAPIANLFSPLLGPYAAAPLFVIGIGFYLWHLRATLRARTRWEFDLLLLLLVAVVFFNQLIFAGMATAIRN